MHPIEHLRYLARAQGVDALALTSETAQALASLRADHANLVIACRRIIERHPTVAPLWWLCAHLLAAEDPVERSWSLVADLDGDVSSAAIAGALAPEITIVTIGRPDTVEAAFCRRPDIRVLCADSRFEASSFMQRLERFDVECEPVPSESLARATEIADLVMIEVVAVCPERVLAPVGSRVLAATAASTGTPVWAAVGLGRRLPPPYVDRIGDIVVGDGLDAGGMRPWDVDVDEVPVDLLDRVVSADGAVSDVRVGLGADVPCVPELLRFARHRPVEP